MQRGRAALWAVLVLSAAVCAESTANQAAGRALHAAVTPQQQSYRAAYWYVVCEADRLLQPNSTAELAASIKQLNKQAQSSGEILKIRATRNKFHSSATFPCPQQSRAQLDPGTPPPPRSLTVGVLHAGLSKVLAVDAVARTMRVGAGMDINQFTAAATRAGMSVQVGSLTAYAGLTLGGVLATSAHGSGDQAVSSLADTVLEATWVDGAGGVHTSRAGSAELRAVCGGLGVVGVVTELLIQMTAPSNTRLQTVYMRSDADLWGDIANMLKVAPHILIFWRPDLGQYSAYLTRESRASSSSVNAAAVNTVLPRFQANLNVSQPFRMWQLDVNNTDPLSGAMCPLARNASVATPWASAGSKPLLDVVAPTNQMQAAECGDECTWVTPNVLGTAEDVEFTIEHAQLQSWISDVKSIFAKELPTSGVRCMGLGYMWIRFGRGTNDSLATNSGLTRPVYVQSTWLRSRIAFSKDGTWLPIRYGFVPDLVEEMTLCKYNGRPHWGKNFDRTFSHPRCAIKPKYPGFDDMLKQQSKYDPARIFESELFEKVRTQAAYTPFPGCAITKACYCTADVHCGSGFKCVPALSMPAYKVCKPAGLRGMRLRTGGSGVATTQEAGR